MRLPQRARRREGGLRIHPWNCSKTANPFESRAIPTLSGCHELLALTNRAGSKEMDLRAVSSHRRVDRRATLWAEGLGSRRSARRDLDVNLQLARASPEAACPRRRT